MKRFTLDISILIVILAVMGVQFLPKVVHEVLGLVLFAGVVWHLWLNHKWFDTLKRGKYTKLRTLQVGLSILLILAFLTAMATGVIISSYVFKEVFAGVPTESKFFIYQLHISSAYLMIILGGMHIGVHWQMLWQRIKKLPIIGNLRECRTSRFCILACIGCLGVLISRLEHVGDRLIMQYNFDSEISWLPSGAYYLLILCLMGLYAIGFYYLQEKLQKNRIKQKGEKTA